MTYIIYPDVMLLWNCLINMMVLFLSSRILNYKSTVIRKIVYSFIAGGVMTLGFIFTYHLNGYIYHILYAATYMIMIKTYFRGNFNIEYFFEIFVSVISLIILNGIFNIFFKGQIRNVIIGMLPIIPVFFLISLFSIGAKNISETSDNQYDISFSLGGKIYSCRAYYDTGNCLTDPCSGCPVVIMDYRYFEKIFKNQDSYIEEYHNTGFFDYICMNRDCAINFYPLAYKTVDTGMAVMPVFKIEALFFRNKNKRIENVICGISRCELGRNNYEILLNRNIKPDRKEKFK